MKKEFDFFLGMEVEKILQNVRFAETYSHTEGNLYFIYRKSIS